MHIGRPEEARATLARFGSMIVAEMGDRDEKAKIRHAHLPPVDKHYLGPTVALTIVGLVWGFVNFGLLLWLPGQLIQEGRQMGTAGYLT
jgi:MFS transporter, putative metabolite:H+ symporter